MPKKTAKTKIKPKVKKVKRQAKRVDAIKEIAKEGEVVLGVTPCLVCGKPATIISPNGNPFCDLACQTNYGD